MTFNGSVTGSTIGIVSNVINISAEVGFGVTQTTSVSATVNVPPYSTYYVTLGSVIRHRSGTMTTIYEDCSRSYSNYSVNYTTGEYVRWYE